MAGRLRADRPASRAAALSAAKHARQTDPSREAILNDNDARKLLSIDPADLFGRLVGTGRMMIFTTTGHVTHERIGIVETVTRADGWAAFGGSAHDSRIRLDSIVSVSLDRSRRIGEKAYPRIELNNAAGDEIACIVGFEGLEPFDKALGAVKIAAELEPRVTRFNSMPEAKEVASDDPGLRPFDEARQTAMPVVVEIALPDFVQRWTGQVPELKVSHGFINVMEPDFHLHLRGGSIADWRDMGTGRLEALGPDGADLGFSVTARN